MAALHAAIVLALAAPHAAAAGKVCSITDHAYGGSPSSKDNALAIQAAIADCSAGGGGGTVVVPAGHGAFATGPVVVAGQEIVLRFESGAELVAAYGPEDWPLAPKGEGRPAAAAAAADGQGSGSYIDFLTFSNCSGCGLVGDGTIFGKGGRPPAGNDWYYLFDQGKIKAIRPHLLVVSHCADFTMTGITILDAPFFNVKLNNVAKAEISHVNITSTWYVDPKTNKLMEPHNTDGIDPGGGSSDIHIHDVFIHNGDDSVAVKPSTGACTRNILVEDSVFEKGHGCSIGSVGSGCVEDVVFRNITMRSQLCGCRVKSYSSGPGYIRNVSWIDITMTDTDACLQVNAMYKTPPKHPTHWINVSGLTFKNVVGVGCGKAPQLSCPAQAPCTGIVLDHVKLSGKMSPGGKMQCDNAHGSAKDVAPKSCLVN